MRLTAGITILACSTLVGVGAPIGLLAQQKNGTNPLLKEPLRLKQGQLAGVSGRNQAIAVFKGIPFGAPPVGAARWRARHDRRAVGGGECRPQPDRLAAGEGALPARHR